MKTASFVFFGAVAGMMLSRWLAARSGTATRMPEAPDVFDLMLLVLSAIVLWWPL